jgi:hypothetical protein
MANFLNSLGCVMVAAGLVRMAADSEVVMPNIQEIVTKKIVFQQSLTKKQLEAYRKVSIIADMMLKKYPCLQPRERQCQS